MRLYPNPSQWVTIWLTTGVVIAALGHGERRAPVAYLIAGAIRAWSQSKNNSRRVWNIVGGTIVTILVLLAAVILVHPKPA